MALTKDEKNQVVAEMAELLGHSKMTVVAKYEGTSVQAMQALRRQARDNGTKVKVAKNRLVKKAIEQTDSLKGADTSMLEGMLLYAFNDEDEVAPAHSLNDFAKTNPSLEFVGAFTADGKFMAVEEVKTLAALPGKDQLLAEVVAMLMSPVIDVASALSGNLHALLDGVEAKVTT